MGAEEMLAWLYPSSSLNALKCHWHTSAFLNGQSLSFLAVDFQVTCVVSLFLQSLSDERFRQQEEKMQQLWQDLRRVQNLCSSAERELRYEREKNVDLQKQNLLLQQECTKVGREQGELFEESFASFYRLWEV